MFLYFRQQEWRRLISTWTKGNNPSISHDIQGVFQPYYQDIPSSQDSKKLMNSKFPSTWVWKSVAKKLYSLDRDSRGRNPPGRENYTVKSCTWTQVRFHSLGQTKISIKSNGLSSCPGNLDNLAWNPVFVPSRNHKYYSVLSGQPTREFRK